MTKEKPESELARLTQEQRKAGQDEIFGGFSAAERAEYDRKAGRINALTCWNAKFGQARPLKRKVSDQSRTEAPVVQNLRNRYSPK
jgi:hypothetical protein